MIEQYRIIPSSMPHLQQFISLQNWDSVNKQLDLVIKENKDLDAFDWITHLGKNHTEYQNNSFYKNEETLSFILQEKNKEIATIKFKELKLISHYCGFEDCFTESEITSEMIHGIQTQYSSSEIIKPKEDLAMLGVEEQNKIIDSEWNSEN